MQEHYYDDDGRLLRTVITREAEWDATQRGWMLGLADRESRQCKRCGGDLAETLDDQWRWVPDGDPHICLRCEGSHRVERAHKDDPRAASMLHVMRKVPNPHPQPKGKPRKRRIQQGVTRRGSRRGR